MKTKSVSHNSVKLFPYRSLIEFSVIQSLEKNATICYNCYGDFMTEIYIVRHCEAIGNVKQLFQGHTDLDITALGIKQLECLAERFKNIPIERIYSSPLIRARKTAEAVASGCGASITEDSGLTEVNCGDMDGKPFSEIFGKNPVMNEIWLEHPQDFAPEGGEKMTDAYERIWNTVKRIAAENRGKKAVCATHGGVIRCLNCRLLKNDINRLREIPFADNTAVTLIEFDDEMKPSLAYCNDISHLPEALRNANSRVYSEETKK